MSSDMEDCDVGGLLLLLFLLALDILDLAKFVVCLQKKNTEGRSLPTSLGKVLQLVSSVLCTM